MRWAFHLLCTPLAEEGQAVRGCYWHPSSCTSSCECRRVIAGLNELWGYLSFCAWGITVDLSLASVNSMAKKLRQRRELYWKAGKRREEAEDSSQRLGGGEGETPTTNFLLQLFFHQQTHFSPNLVFGPQHIRSFNQGFCTLTVLHFQGGKNKDALECSDYTGTNLWFSWHSLGWFQNPDQVGQVQLRATIFIYLFVCLYTYTYTHTA